MRFYKLLRLQFIGQNLYLYRVTLNVTTMIRIKLLVLTKFQPLSLNAMPLSSHRFFASSSKYRTSKAYFPLFGRLAACNPSLKKGKKTDSNHYRPVTLLHIMSKVMETVINTQLFKYLDKNNIIRT
nr:unnamed protein product [Callosobruchus analis]